MRDAPKTDVLIAPSEIDELLTRLTEHALEAVPSHQARTLEGLSAETGIPVIRLQAELARMRGRPKMSISPVAIAGVALIGGYGIWVMKQRPPEPAPVVEQPTLTPVAVETDLSGLVPLDAVTFGPDFGAEQVDPNFQPEQPLPEGLSFAASTGGVLWGTGDHKAAVIQQKFSDEEKAALQKTAVELLKHLRAEAARRHLPVVKEPENGRTGFPVTLASESYYGRSSISVSVPPPGENADGAFQNRARQAAKQLVDQLIQNIRQRREFDRMQGP